jgi:hypothetical protein
MAGIVGALVGVAGTLVVWTLGRRHQDVRDKRRIKIDLYERRYAVWCAVKDVVRDAKLKKRDVTEPVAHLRHAISQLPFLFGDYREIAKLADQIEVSKMRVENHHGRLKDADIDESERTRLLVEIGEAEQLTEEAGEKFDKLVSPYLTLFESSGDLPA